MPSAIKSAHRVDSELCIAYQTGDKTALDKLLLRHRGFIYNYAKKWEKPGLEHDDLMQSAVLGIHEAAKRFEPERNIVFLTYALWWVRKIFFLENEQAKRYYSAGADDQTEELFDSLEERPPTAPQIHKFPKKKLKAFIAKAKREGISEDEVRTIYLAMDLGTPAKQKRWKRQLWGQWLHRHSTQVIDRAIKIWENKAIDKPAYTGDPYADLRLEYDLVAEKLKAADDVICRQSWVTGNRGPVREWLRKHHDKANCNRCKSGVLQMKMRKPREFKLRLKKAG